MPEFIPAQKPHIQQVDYIRAIASLAVALFHLGGKSLPGLQYGWLGVEMFFLLSGFIICWAIPKDYTLKMAGKFISKRIIRIEPPYLISVVMAIIAHYLWDANYKADWLNILLHIGYLNNFFHQSFLSPVYWTLGIEFQFYLFIALCFPLIIKKLGSVFVVALCFLPIFYHSGATLISFFPIFAIGIIYYKYYIKATNLYLTIVYGLIATVCSTICLGWVLTAVALFALVLLLLPLKSYPIVSFFSKISFSLYLTHDIVGSSIVAHMGMNLPKTIFYKGVEFITGITISIAFAYLFYVLIEATFLRLSKKVHYK